MCPCNEIPIAVSGKCGMAVCSQIVLIMSLVIFLNISACSKREQQDESVSIGQQIYKQNCKTCHAQGINGAPILGNKKMWSKRIPQGIETLIEHASNGYGLMPKKGGREDLTHEEISEAVNYMVNKVK